MVAVRLISAEEYRKAGFCSKADAIVFIRRNQILGRDFRTEADFIRYLKNHKDAADFQRLAYDKKKKTEKLPKLPKGRKAIKHEIPKIEIDPQYERETLDVISRLMG